MITDLDRTATGADVLKTQIRSMATDILEEEESYQYGSNRYPLGRNTAVDRLNGKPYGKPTDESDEHVINALRTDVAFDTQYEEEGKPIARNRIGQAVNPASRPPGVAWRRNYVWPAGTDPDTRFGDTVVKTKLDSAKASLTFDSADYKACELVSRANELQGLYGTALTAKVTAPGLRSVPAPIAAGRVVQGDGESVAKLMSHGDWEPVQDAAKADPAVLPMAGVPSTRADLPPPPAESRKVTDDTNYGTEIGVGGAVRPPLGTEQGVDELIRGAMTKDEVLDIVRAAGWPEEDVEKVIQNGPAILSLGDALALL